MVARVNTPSKIVVVAFEGLITVFGGTASPGQKVTTTMKSSGASALFVSRKMSTVKH